jgi:hypothetical protein
MGFNLAFKGLKYEIIKYRLIIAKGCKIVVDLGKMYNDKV